MEMDKKDAVLIGTSLSNQLITVALAMLAIIGGVHTYIIDKREVNWIYYTLIFLSFLLFIMSIYIGGKGINIIREDGFEGNWNLKSTHKYFNKQAIFCFIGLFIFMGSTFAGKEKVDLTYKELQSVNINLEKHLNLLEKKTFDYNLTLKEIDSLKIEINDLKNIVLSNFIKYKSCDHKETSTK